MAGVPAYPPTPEIDPRFGDPDARPTPWDAVVAVLETAELFWISTIRSDSRPHVTPLPAVWRDDALHFCTGPTEQKAVNLASHNECVLTTGSNGWKTGLDVVVEGAAHRVEDETRLELLAEAWAEKYAGDWVFEVRNGAFHHGPGEAHVFEVRPRKILAFAKGKFSQTRFRLGDPGASGRLSPVPDDRRSP